MDKYIIKKIKKHLLLPLTLCKDPRGRGGRRARGRELPAARTRWWSSRARARKFGPFSRSEGGALADPHVSGRDRILWRTVGRVRHRKEEFCGALLEGCATEMREIFFF